MSQSLSATRTRSFTQPSAAARLQIAPGAPPRRRRARRRTAAPAAMRDQRGQATAALDAAPGPAWTPAAITSASDRPAQQRVPLRRAQRRVGRRGEERVEAAQPPDAPAATGADHRTRLTRLASRGSCKGEVHDERHDERDPAAAREGEEERERHRHRPGGGGARATGCRRRSPARLSADDAHHHDQREDVPVADRAVETRICVSVCDNVRQALAEKGVDPHGDGDDEKAPGRPGGAAGGAPACSPTTATTPGRRRPGRRRSSSGRGRRTRASTGLTQPVNSGERSERGQEQRRRPRAPAAGTTPTPPRAAGTRRRWGRCA